MKVTIDIESLSVTVVTKILFALLMGQITGGCMQEVVFVKNQRMLGEVNSTTSTAMTKIQCGQICAKDSVCTSFVYDRESKTCDMSPDVISKPGKNSYIKSSRNGCLAKPGYRLWSYPNMVMCLKYAHTYVTNYTEALRKCTESGGHLPLMDSNQAAWNIADALWRMGAPVNEKLYLDGFDYNGNQAVFETWKREPLPWTSWARGNDFNSHEHCIVGVAADGLRMLCGDCTLSRQHHLCQIDV